MTHMSKSLAALTQFGLFVLLGAMGSLAMGSESDPSQKCAALFLPLAPGSKSFSTVFQEQGLSHLQHQTRIEYLISIVTKGSLMSAAEVSSDTRGFSVQFKDKIFF